MTDTLSKCIRDGTFPETNEPLSAEATPDSVSELLASITASKDDLRREIQDVSKDESSNVDQWIVQAKKIQDDIVKCKNDARLIIEEHERVETLRSVVGDTSSKVQLLETEIAFTKALEYEIQSIAEITQVLNEAGDNLVTQDPVSAVGKIVSLNTSIRNITARRTRSLLESLESELRQKSREQLEALLGSRWVVTGDGQSANLVVHSDGSSLEESGKENHVSTDSILNAMKDLNALPFAVQLILRKINSFIGPITSSNPSAYPSAVEATHGSLSMQKSSTRSEPLKVLDFTRTILQFLRANLPDLVKDTVGNEMSSELTASLESVWLDPALPHNLEDLRYVDPLREGVTEVVTMLKQYSWSGHSVLTDWIEQIPRVWLAKRRMTSLDAVRKAFSLARGTLRPVERVERQTVSGEELQGDPSNEEDDWNANWEDDVQEAEIPKSNNVEEEEASGWDFETESDHSDTKKEDEIIARPNEEDDTGDAWGWGDDDDTKNESHEPALVSRAKHLQPNGDSASVNKTQEMVLTETYYITDIPDYILEIVGKDVADAHELQNSSSKYFDTSAPATGLAALPNLTLSLFRATAPTYYSLPSAAYTLTNINLYNDILYIAQKLSESTDPSSASGQHQQTLTTLHKFARQIYTAELDTQRTILSDLLDGAQGFESCNTYPQSQSCRDAIASVTDRLRALHSSWSTILGTSHLQQFLGSLITTVLDKFIKDVEDLDDISEAESKQLVTFTNQILTLDDLFVAAVFATPDSQTPTSQIALYVPNYLRFRYLQEILESSLVDIKYLWTEGELKLEFSTAEVVDLIKALFAESQHRRNAIREIREAA